MVGIISSAKQALISWPSLIKPPTVEYSAGVSNSAISSNINEVPPDLKMARGRKARLRREREVKEKLQYEESIRENQMQIALLKEAHEAYTGTAGIHWKMPAHHASANILDGYVTPKAAEFVDDYYKTKNIRKTSRTKDKAIRIEERLFTREELEAQAKKENSRVATRHHMGFGAEKIYALLGNQQTVDAIFNAKLGVQPVFEENRLLPDPKIQLEADAAAKKKQDRLWAPIKRIKAAALCMSRTPVRLIPRPGLIDSGAELVHDLNQRVSLDAVSLGGSIATASELGDQSHAQLGRMAPQQHTVTFDDDDGVNSTGADRSLFSEFSVGRSMSHIAVPMVKQRGFKGLDGKKIKGLHLESRKSKMERGGERKSIREFNKRLQHAILMASKIRRDDLLVEQ